MKAGFRTLVHAVLVAVIAVAGLLAVSAAPSSANTRVALVVGNSDYASVPKLPNPVNDAAAIGQSLSRLDFDVTVTTNLGKADLERQLADFSDKARDADIAVVFYAGHGIEMGGENYLIPVDATLKSDNRIKFETVSLNDILSTIEGGKGLKLVLLDACRDNPFAAAMTGSKIRSVKRGLARVETTPGVYVSYAAAAGTTADDGDAKHSPYTEALLANLEQPGVELNFLFRKVAAYVHQKTAGRQTPFEYGRLPDESIFLKAPVALPEVVPVAADPCRDAAVHWAAIEDKGNRTLFEDHLKRFGTCSFATLARAALDQMTVNAVKLQPQNDKTANERTVAENTAALAGDEADKPETQSIAALTTTPADLTAETAPEDTTALVRQIQEQLNRVGCRVGNPDGEWGPRSVRALNKFRRLGGTKLETSDPSPDMLLALNAANGTICPLECGAAQVLKNGQCIAKTCSANRVLSAAGLCVRQNIKEAETERKKVDRPQPKVVEQPIKQKNVSRKKPFIVENNGKKRQLDPDEAGRMKCLQHRFRFECG
ncbi:caspase family protein [Pararhizobium sp.]|uniref:caspase family protein n=1 Tax=Pararhizobium sp. TaxID=1977563 RepID=UPI00271E3252|nr:caspase family protein [Pararhizobium sp.]MDO9414749.1 caspase family protein [Pararhizobium sp.]